MQLPAANTTMMDKPLSGGEGLGEPGTCPETANMNPKFLVGLLLLTASLAVLPTASASCDESTNIEHETVTVEKCDGPHYHVACCQHAITVGAGAYCYGGYCDDGVTFNGPMVVGVRNVSGSPASDCVVVLTLCVGVHT
jgi:hypothetical protein